MFGSGVGWLGWNPEVAGVEEWFQYIVHFSKEQQQQLAFTVALGNLVPV